MCKGYFKVNGGWLALVDDAYDDDDHDARIFLKSMTFANAAKDTAIAAAASPNAVVVVVVVVVVAVPCELWQLSVQLF